MTISATLKICKKVLGSSDSKTFFLQPNNFTKITYSAINPESTLICLFQAKMVDGLPSEKVSKLSFVDLAGTDRRQAKVCALNIS